MFTIKKYSNIKGNIILPGAQSEFAAVNEGYREVKFNYLSFLHSKSTFFDARVTYIESLSNYHKSAATIERLIGEKINALKQKLNPKE